MTIKYLIPTERIDIGARHAAEGWLPKDCEVLAVYRPKAFPNEHFFVARTRTPERWWGVFTWRMGNQWVTSVDCNGIEDAAQVFERLCVRFSSGA